MEGGTIEIIGLFITLAGFVIGLGAVTVIDLHGFLGRTSSYWTVATTRTHKITKPLIWIGTALVATGLLLLHLLIGWTGQGWLQVGLLSILVGNGLFLSFHVSPYLLKQEAKKKEKTLLPKVLQRQITVSFIVSFLGWWTLLFSVVRYVTVLR